MRPGPTLRFLGVVATGAALVGVFMVFDAYRSTTPGYICGRPMTAIEWYTGVRHPRLLQLVDDCTSVRGFIRHIQVYEDGRTQLQLELFSPADRDWLTQENKRRFSGRLIVTLPAMYPWKAFDGLPPLAQACDLDVTVSGARVLHRYRGRSWGEMQPTWRIQPHSTGSTCKQQKLSTRIRAAA